MIELKSNSLKISFPEVHKNAQCSIDFQRTLRIPDDGREYPLPAGLGEFPLHHIEDFAARIPESWNKRGGVLMPMYQSEALWLNFNSAGYPFAVKVAAGKINAVSGEDWKNGLSDDPQDYLVIPDQPWLDGYNVGKDLIRQFVAMPLGQRYSAEEQITGKAEFGGIQIIVYPMKQDRYCEWMESLGALTHCYTVSELPCEYQKQLGMGLAAGGLMRQEIYEDKYGIDAWDTDHSSRCFVHLVNSESYADITGHLPPHPPLSKKEYEESGIPWFSYYDDKAALQGAGPLKALKSLSEVASEKGNELWDNGSMNIGTVTPLKKQDNHEVSEGRWD